MAMDMDDKAKREGVEGAVILICCLLFSTGVALVLHSLGWFLITLSASFVGVRMMWNYGR